VVGLGGVGLGVAECEAAVVEALQEQDDVCERIVNGKDDLKKLVSRELLVPRKVDKRTIVGIMPCRTPPAMLKKSPAVVIKLDSSGLNERFHRSGFQHTQPDNDELNAEAIGGLFAVVLDDLG
jgi:hypothetical protein